jgi:hypothetical protein
METNPTNPLQKYFRRPGVHIKLPSGGRFFDDGELELSLSGELAVLPMTAADEITLKNPDMLLNGDALDRLFRSCVPGIKNPRKISIPDMDVILLAIKLASYGEDLPVSANCPKCETKIELDVGIRPILDAVQPLSDSSDVRLGDEVVVKVRPYDFESKTILDMSAFEERQLYKYLIGNEEMSDQERGRLFNESFDRFANLNLDLIAKCVVGVVTPEGEVTDYEFIKEFIRNLDKDSVATINNTIKSFSDAGIDRKISLKCPSEECQHEWDTDLVFDPASFFA